MPNLPTEFQTCIFIDWIAIFVDYALSIGANVIPPIASVIYNTRKIIKSLSTNELKFSLDITCECMYGSIYDTQINRTFC